VGEAVGVIPITVCWGVAVYRLPSTVRSWHSPARRYLWAAVLCLAVGMTLDHPAIYVEVGRSLGLANVSNLLAYGSGMVASWCTLAFLHYSTSEQASDQAVARRAVHLLRQRLLAALLAMAAAFPFGPAHHPNLQAFGRARPADLATVAYWLALLAWAVYALVAIIRLCWQLSSATSAAPRATTTPELPLSGSARLGLRLIAAGAVVTLVRFCYQYGLYFPLPVFAAGRPAVVGQELMHVLNMAALLAGGAMALGAGLPAWVYRVRAFQRWRLHRRDLRTLAPLSCALREVRPTMASLVQGHVRDRLALRNLQFRLDQRVMGIWDGYLDLRDHWPLAGIAPARRLDLAAGITDDGMLAAVDEALYVAVAVGARQSAVAVDCGRAPTRPEQASLDEELNHLLRVATFFRQPQVQAVAQRVLAGRLEECRASRSGLPTASGDIGSTTTDAVLSA
jgi:hypothetical protein